MKKLFYEPFPSTIRSTMADECIKHINCGRKALYLLPSREAMFHVRRLFTEKLGGLFRCSVFGFDDLEKLLLGEPVRQGRVIGDMEERILFSHVMNRIPAGNAFEKVKDKPGFLELLTSTIRQLKRSMATPEGFMSRVSHLEGDTLLKCEGLYQIYNGYENMKSEKGLMDVDDISLGALKACADTGFFRDVGVIVIDGFFNIDPVNIKLIEEINNNHGGIDLYACIPYRNINNEQFLQEGLIEDFKRLGFESVELGVENGYSRKCGSEAAYNCAHSSKSACTRAESLQKLTQSLYSGSDDIIAGQDSLKISFSPCLDHEIRTAARKIKELVQSEGVRPSDTAVVTADTELYRAKVSEIFEEYGIPLNNKQHGKLVSVPLIKDLLAVWRSSLKEEEQNAFLSIVTSKYLIPDSVLAAEGFETGRLYRLALEVLKTADGGDAYETFLSLYKKSEEDRLLKEEKAASTEEVSVKESNKEELSIEEVSAEESNKEESSSKEVSARKSSKEESSTETASTKEASAKEASTKKEESTILQGEIQVNIKTVENSSHAEQMKSYIDQIREFRRLLREEPDKAMAKFSELLDCFEIADNISALYKEGILDEELWLRDIEALGSFKGIAGNLDRAYEDYGFVYEDTPELLIREVLDELSGMDNSELSRDAGGVRFIPPDLVRGQSYDTVFVLGLNEGSFPSPGKAVRLFNLQELKELYSLGINLSEPGWELEREKLRFNACIAAAGKRLFLSCRTADEDGGVMIASPFIDEVVSILDNECRKKVIGKPVSMRERMKFDMEPLSMDEAARRTSVLLRNGLKPEPQALSSNIQENVFPGIKEGVLSGIKEGVFTEIKDVVFPGIKERVLSGTNKGISREMEKRLEFPARAAEIECGRVSANPPDEYDGRLNEPVLAQRDARYGFSVSQLNSYVWCPFTYFAERVIGLKDEDDSREEVLDTGIFYHKVLEEYLRGRENPCEPDVERLDRIFERLSPELNTGTTPAALRSFVLEQKLAILRAFIVHDAKNMDRYRSSTGCTLMPHMLEEPFEIELGTGGGILRGYADRVDLELDEKGKRTGRFIVYDYKTKGIKSIKECIEGRDFQLPLYHKALKRKIREKFGIEEPECLALLYYSIENLDWNGIIRDDIKKFLFEPRKVKSFTPTKANMELVLSWSEGEALSVMEDIRKGRFMLPGECPVNPFVGCCSFRSLCRYERNRLAGKAGAEA